jgi:hypothetical protein
MRYAQPPWQQHRHQRRSLSLDVSGDYNAGAPSTPGSGGHQRHSQRHQHWWGEEGQVSTPHSGRQPRQQAWTPREEGPGRPERLEVFSGAQEADWGDTVSPSGVVGSPRGVQQPSRHRQPGPGRMGRHISPAVLPGARATQEEYRPSEDDEGYSEEEEEEEEGTGWRARQQGGPRQVRAGAAPPHMYMDEVQGPMAPGYPPRYLA